MNVFQAFSDPERARVISERIHAITHQPWSIMEICGGQTHAIMRYAITQLLPTNIELIHGPGCPICVTPMGMIDAAIRAANLPGVVVCTFGDMIRVPGSTTSLAQEKAKGATVMVVYSPLDAVDYAAQFPDREVVFFAVGFETTAPATALAVFKAKSLGLKNFSMLVSHVRVPPALTALLSDSDHRIDGVLAAGHVCTIMGVGEYQPLAAQFRVPMVVTGFEPVDILQGILCCIEQLEQGEASVHNAYPRSVAAEGNPRARALMETIYEVCDLEWRGLGCVPHSGLRLNANYHAFDAARRFHLTGVNAETMPVMCQSGRVLSGAMKPDACPYFGSVCTPDRPLGAPMVSAEGACSAYYLYGRH